MKKIFFLLAFAFIGQQAFSQMYIVMTQAASVNDCGNNSNQLTLTTISPSGDVNKSCISSNIGTTNSGLKDINEELNNIMSQGYKLINTDYGDDRNGIQDGFYVEKGVTFYLAIPWTPSGLEEVPQTLKNLNIHPNPANEFIDIILDYNIKSSSEIVIYSEAGYIYHKEKVSKLNRNEPYRLDISKVPAGKYFITIVNDKSYTTAQKLIII